MVIIDHMTKLLGMGFHPLPGPLGLGPCDNPSSHTARVAPTSWPVLSKAT